MINYYKELGVDKNASLQEIKQAYLQQLKKYHPDVFDGDESFAQEKTSRLNECYNILKDKNLREEYDKKLFGQPTVNKVQNQNYKKENIFKEFTKNLKVNLKTENNKTIKPENNKTIKPEKNKKIKIKNNKKTKINNTKIIEKTEINNENALENIEEKEKKNLSMYITLIILFIFIILIVLLII